jgi:hypothetical protein
VQVHGWIEKLLGKNVHLIGELGEFGAIDRKSSCVQPTERVIQFAVVVDLEVWSLVEVLGVVWPVSLELEECIEVVAEVLVQLAVGEDKS